LVLEICQALPIDQLGLRFINDSFAVAVKDPYMQIGADLSDDD